MTAVEKALRHIEQLMARRAKPLINKPRPPKRKPAKRKAKSARMADQKKPVVTPTREAYQPPVTHPDFTELRETFAPTPSCEVSVTAEGTKLVPPLPFVTGGGVRPSSRRHPPQRRAPRRRQGGCLCLS